MSNFFKSKRGMFGFLVFSIFLTVVANPSAKPPSTTWKFRFTGGLVDAGSEILYGNELHARWIVDSGLTSGIFKWQYRDTSIEGDEWHPLPDGRIEYGRTFAVVPNADHFEIMCWPQFDAGPTVVTNGVYHLSGAMHPMTGEEDLWLTPQTEIKADKRSIYAVPTAPYSQIIPSELIDQFILEEIE